MQQTRFTLDFVEGHRLVALQKNFWIAPRKIQHIQIIQRVIATTAGGEYLGQGALARLSGTRDHHGRHDAKAVCKAACNRTGYCQIIHDLHDSYSRSGKMAVSHTDTGRNVGREAEGWVAGDSNPEPAG